MAKVWQVSAGEDGRDYSAMFRAYDLMFVGPSRFGPFDRDVYAKAAEDGKIRRSAVRRLAEYIDDVATGDVVVLRLGQRAVALGVVDAEGYRHDETFDDVQGLDLGHTRRVSWQEALDGELAALQADTPVFPATRGGRFSRVFDEAILARLRGLVERCAERPLRARPPVAGGMGLAAFGQALAAGGFAGAERVVEALARVQRLTLWYREFGARSGRPSERELSAYVVVPLLQALGWSEEQLAFEWKRVDIAGFSRAPNTADECVLVCESKLADGLLDLVYVKRHLAESGLTECRSLLMVQDGRFYVHRRAAGREWPTTPTGYFDALRLRCGEVVGAGMDAVATLRAITPEGARAWAAVQGAEKPAETVSATAMTTGVSATEAAATETTSGPETTSTSPPEVASVSAEEKPAS